MKRLTLSLGFLLFLGTFSTLAQEGALEQYQRQYERGVERIESIFREKRLAMPAAHVKALRRLAVKYQRDGDLESMLAVQNERERFVLDPRGKSVPALQSPSELARLLSAYKQQYAAVAAERDQSLAALKKRYLAALKALQVKLTQEGKIAAAKQVMKAISSDGGMVWKPAEKKPGPAAQAPASSTATPAPADDGWTSESPDAFFDEFFE